MRFCTECGNENPTADNPFCIHCGARIEANVIISDPADRTQIAYHSDAGTNHDEVVLDAYASDVAICQDDVCTECGTPIGADNRFCIHCGARRDSNTPFLSAPVQTTAGIPMESQNAAKSSKPAKPNKRSGLFIAVMAMLLFIIIGAAITGVYALIYGADSLPVIGHFFVQSVVDDRESDADDEDEDEDSTPRPTASPSPEPKSDIPTETPAAQTNEPSPSPSMDAVSSELLVTASSELPGYPAESIINRNNDTAWACEADASGNWANVMIPYGSDITLYGIYLKNGYWKSQYDLIRNGRVKEIKVEFDDGSSEIISVSDSTLSNFAAFADSEGELLLFAQPHTTANVKISVLDVYPGANNTAFITEISGLLTPEAPATPAITEAPVTPAPAAMAAPMDAPAPAVTQAPATKPSAATEASNSYTGMEALILDGGNRYYQKAEISGLSKSELRLLRNGIYALSGKIFSSADLKDYFNAKDWYVPFSSDDEQIEQAFNRYQTANRNLIIKVEREHGYRY